MTKDTEGHTGGLFRKQRDYCLFAKNRGDMSQSRPRGRCVSRGALIEAWVLVRYTVTFPHRREENGFWFLKGKTFFKLGFICMWLFTKSKSMDRAMGRYAMQQKNSGRRAREPAVQPWICSISSGRSRGTTDVLWFRNRKPTQKGLFTATSSSKRVKNIVE